VVGAQSAGKSSVLEAISGIRFRQQDDSPTQFTIELVLRRSDKPAVKVSVWSSNSPPSKEATELFTKSCFDSDTLSDIIEKHRQTLSLEDDDANKFSKDILRVEVAGPELYPVNLVDLPGLANDGQDVKSEPLVDELVESYMRRPTSIILAVVAATNLLAMQAVVQKSEKA
jgi:GTPase SAR1 family protein